MMANSLVYFFKIIFLIIIYNSNLTIIINSLKTIIANIRSINKNTTITAVISRVNKTKFVFLS